MDGLADVVVEREGDDLLVSWTGSLGEDVAITVGPSPDQVGPVKVVHNGADHVRIGGLDPKIRHYVRVTGVDGRAMVAGERLVPLAGALNFRDLGGYPTTDGRRVRWGRVYRSDGLARLTDADVEYLTGLGVRLVLDFRNDVECETDPSRLADHPEIERQRLPIGGEAGEQRQMIDRILGGEISAFGEDLVAQSYADMLDARADAFGTAVAHAADPDRHAVLFHCTAGKDRTGVTAALLLSALGVADDDIVADYHLTTTYRSGRRLAELTPQLQSAGVDVEAVLPFFTAQPGVMTATLAGLRRRHGSVEAYLTGFAGVRPATLRRLRQVMLEPPEG